MCLYFVRYLSRKGVIDIDLVGWHMTEVPPPPPRRGWKRKKKKTALVYLHPSTIAYHENPQHRGRAGGKKQKKRWSPFTHR